MATILELFRSNMIFVFFVYGLAFFSMGLAVALESRRQSELKLATSLIWLAGFGVIHGCVEWVDMFLLIPATGLSPDVVFSIRLVRTMLLAASATLLVQFASKLISDTWPDLRWLRWLPAALFTFWVLSFMAPHLYPVQIGEGPTNVGMCLQCHGGASATYLVASKEWLTGADVWVRYLLYLPGSLLAALAVFAQHRVFDRMKLPQVSRDAYAAAAIFSVNALIAGLIVPPASFFPASVVNYSSFFAVVGVPVQIFRAVAAVAIAYFVVRMLRVFEIEHRRRVLEQAQRELEVKSTLLQEMHHRVRNNLQTVIDLLSWELMREDARSAEEVLKASISRIKSIASVHSLLAQETLGTIDFNKIARDILAIGQAASAAGNKHISVVVDGAELALPSRKATSVALLVNELVMNAVKHAFQGRDEGKIEIHAWETDDTIFVQVEDDGVGLPQGFDINGQRGLGMRIIQGLVKSDLKGDFYIASDGGTTATVVFPRN